MEEGFLSNSSSNYKDCEESDGIASPENSSSGDESHNSDTTDGKYNLRTSSIINRIQIETKIKSPKEPKPKTRPPPLSKYRRKSANMRERTRMKDMNDAYENLQRILPQELVQTSSAKGVTKINTLRLALYYISALREVMGYSNSSSLDYSSDCSGTSSETLSHGVQSDLWNKDTCSNYNDILTPHDLPPIFDESEEDLQDLLNTSDISLLF